MSKKSSKELLADLLNGDEPPRCVLVCSPDLIRSDRVLKVVLESVCQEAFARPRIYRGSSLSSKSLSQVKSDLLSNDLFSSTACVLVREAETLSKTLEKELADCMSNVTSGSSLIISSTTLSAKNALRTQAKKLNCLIDLPALKGAEFVRWIDAELKSAGIKKFSGKVSSGIADIASGSADIAHNIITSLSLYSTSGTVSFAELESLFPSVPDQNEFAFIDLLHSGTEGEIELALQKLWLNGKNPFLLLNLIIRSYSRYIHIRSQLDQGVPAGQIRQSLGMKDWAFNKLLTFAKSRSLPSLHADYKILLHADSKLKNRSLGSAEVIAEAAQAIRA